jgi:hypothetical protein
MESLYTGLFRHAYASLYPAHQRIVSRERFFQCGKAAPLGTLQSLEVLDVYDDAIRIPGVRERKAKAVRVRVTLASGQTDTFVNHEVKIGTRWYWVLNSAAVRAYQAGRCPGVG